MLSPVKYSLNPMVCTSLEKSKMLIQLSPITLPSQLIILQFFHRRTLRQYQRDRRRVDSNGSSSDEPQKPRSSLMRASYLLQERYYSDLAHAHSSDEHELVYPAILQAL